MKAGEDAPSEKYEFIGKTEGIVLAMIDTSKWSNPRKTSSATHPQPQKTDWGDPEKGQTALIFLVHGIRVPDESNH